MTRVPLGPASGRLVIAIIRVLFLQTAQGVRDPALPGAGLAGGSTAGCRGARAEAEQLQARAGGREHTRRLGPGRGREQHAARAGRERHERHPCARMRERKHQRAPAAPEGPQAHIAEGRSCRCLERWLCGRVW